MPVDWTRPLATPLLRQPLTGAHALAARHTITPTAFDQRGSREDDHGRFCSSVFSPASLTALARVAFPAFSPPQAEPSGLGFAWVRRRKITPKRRYLGFWGGGASGTKTALFGRRGAKKASWGGGATGDALSYNKFDIKIVGCMSPQKLFCYHLPTRGRAGVKLGDA